MNKKTPRGIIQASRRELMAMLAAGLTLDAAPGMAQAPGWPSGPGRVIVGFPPGGSTDNLARALGTGFQEQFGKPFVDENRPGAGGWTATVYVSQAKPDGLTLTFNANGITVYGLIQKTNFDAAVDLTPIAMTAAAPVGLVITSTIPAKTLPEFIAYCKAHPNDVYFGSSGVGSVNHLFGELLNEKAGIHMRHVPYRGWGDEVPDLISGRIHISFSSYATAAGLIKSGQIRLLAYGSDLRPEGMMPAPSVKSFGIDYEANFWWGLFGPKGMSPDLQKKINASANKTMGEPAMAKLFKDSGVTGNPMTADKFAAIVKNDFVTMKQLVDAEHIVL